MKNQIVEALPHIFDFDYPLFDPEHKTELETKIIMHYYNREIGLETFALWKLYLEERLNLEMPYYNNLYEIEKNKFDYLINIDTHNNETENVVSSGETDGTSTDTTTTNSTNDRTTTDNDNRTISDTGNDTTTHSIDENVTTTSGSTGNTSTTEEGNSSSNGTTISSDFPQATFNKNVDYATGSQQTQTSSNSGSSSSMNSTASSDSNEKKGGNNVDATYYGKITTDNLIGNGTVKDVGNINVSQNGITHGTDKRNQDSVNNAYVYGTNGSKTQLMVEYRESILNIDKMVVNMLSDLFMGVYD